MIFIHMINPGHRYQEEIKRLKAMMDGSLDETYEGELEVTLLTLITLITLVRQS